MQKILARAPALIAALVVLCWMAELETGRFDTGITATQALYYLTLPSSFAGYLIAEVSVTSGDPFLEWTLRCFSWAALVYLQWKAIVRLPSWLRTRKVAGFLFGTAGALWLLVCFFFLLAFPGSVDDEHGQWPYAKIALAYSLIGIQMLAVSIAARRSRPAVRVEPDDIPILRRGGAP